MPKLLAMFWAVLILGNCCCPVSNQHKAAGSVWEVIRYNPPIAGWTEAYLLEERTNGNFSWLIIQYGRTKNGVTKIALWALIDGDRYCAYHDEEGKTQNLEEFSLLVAVLKNSILFDRLPEHIRQEINKILSLLEGKGKECYEPRELLSLARSVLLILLPSQTPSTQF